MNICGLTTGLDLISAEENNTDSILKPRLSIIVKKKWFANYTNEI